jgi:hypothetical protein
MKKLNRVYLITLLTVLSTLAACGGGDGSSGLLPVPPTVGNGDSSASLPPPGPPVPATAGINVSAFISYLAGLSASDEAMEPSPIADNFSVPDNETSDPQILS